VTNERRGAEAAAIGVLALQGDFAAHGRALEACGAAPSEVRLIRELEGLRGLIIPGGESTTLLRLLREYGFDEALPRFVEEGGALFGTCAGAILLARSVSSPAQWSLGLLDVDIERNGYGRQVDSFETSLDDVDGELARERRAGEAVAMPPPLPAVFIRAPRIRRVGAGVAILAALRGEPVLVRDGPILAATFHPELTRDARVHRYFLDRVASADLAARPEISPAAQP
jgi:5'-phosphate synthase pdxT subunit